MDGRDALFDEDDAERATSGESPRSGVQPEEIEPVARSPATNRTDAGVKPLTLAVALRGCLGPF